MNRKELIYVPAAMAIGGGLWFVMGMKPVWWLAWILPGLLFAIALRTEAWTSRGLVPPPSSTATAPTSPQASPPTADPGTGESTSGKEEGR